MGGGESWREEEACFDQPPIAPGRLPLPPHRDPGSAFRRLVEETTRGGGLNADVVSRALENATA